jgi:ribonuclease HII
VRIVGFDEAGRGALAGPVVVGCVGFSLTRFDAANKRFAEAFSSLTDSKRVSPRVRERLDGLIRAEARYGIGCASAIEIDRLGIVEACRIAARRAYVCLGFHADLALFDRGLSLPRGLPSSPPVASEATGDCPRIPVCFELTKGDASSFHIAAASILAKVWRDALMRRLESQASGYGLAQHKGYGTSAHIDAIRRHGPSRFHRRSFLTRICSGEATGSG